MRSVRLAQAEVKALCHYARTRVCDLAPACSESTWVRPGGEKYRPVRIPAAFAKVEEDDLRGAIEVYGVLAASRLAFATGADKPDPVEAVEIEFSALARGWLTERRRELQAELEMRRATVEISGGTRNDVFILFVLDTVARQVSAGAADLKAVA